MKTLITLLKSKFSATATQLWAFCLDSRNIIKLHVLTTLLFVISTLASKAQTAACESCNQILKDGLYRTIISTKTDNFSQDLKSYFLSEQFKEDLHNGKWGTSLGVTIPINGVPTPFDIGANASNVDVSNFQSRVRQAISVELKQTTFDQLKTAIPDADIARIFKDCIVECDKKGFKVYTTFGENDATFLIRYDPVISTDQMPKVTYFDIVNGSGVRNGPVIGATLGNETIISAQRNPEKDLILLLQTNRGQATARVNGEPSGFNKDLPVGTIISSYLDFQRFSEVTKNNESYPDKTVNLWTSKYSKWAPCDGRVLSGSKLTLLTNSNAPDLRGMFLRGLNVFDSQPPAGTPALNDARKDPKGNRSVGDYEEDGFKSHAHVLSDPGHQHTTLGISQIGNGTSGGPVLRPDNGSNQFQPATSRATTGITVGGSLEGIDENRPKNVAIFYYIRIN